MFGKKKSKVSGPTSVLEPVKVSKEGKKRTLRVTVFPQEGGRPYFADVQPDEEGAFELADKQTFKVVRGSVWEEAGILRALVNEGNPQTINPFSLTGDDTMNPIALHGIASNNLWIQLDTLAKRKSPWKSASTWAFIIIGVVVCLLMLWQVKTIGDGFQNIQHGLDGLKGGATPNGANPSAQAAAGHNNIAPAAANALFFLPFLPRRKW